MEPAVEIMTAERDNSGIEKLSVHPSHIKEAIRRLSNNKMYPLTVSTNDSITLFSSSISAPTIDNMCTVIESPVDALDTEIYMEENHNNNNNNDVLNEFHDIYESLEVCPCPGEVIGEEVEEEGDILSRYYTNT